MELDEEIYLFKNKKKAWPSFFLMVFFLLVDFFGRICIIFYWAAIVAVVSNYK
jgi:predicted PurR-regulated permease PerM